jgi:hypothetical protein
MCKSFLYLLLLPFCPLCDLSYHGHLAVAFRCSDIWAGDDLINCILIFCLCWHWKVKRNDGLVWVLVNGSIHGTAALLCCCAPTHVTVFSSIVITHRICCYMLVKILCVSKEMIYQPCVVSGTIEPFVRPWRPSLHRARTWRPHTQGVGR